MATAPMTFATAYAIQDDYLYIAGKADELDPFAHFTRAWQWYSPKRPNEWIFHDLDWCSSSITAYVPSNTNDWWPCVLDDNGHIEFMDGKSSFTEKIPGAGVYSEDSKGWGYLADLQQIGDSLFACGYRGQVYKRHGPNDWRHFDEGLLQAPDTEMPKRTALSVVNGPHENAIYTAGYQHSDGLPPKAFFWNGELWRELELPPVAERITNLYIENEIRIWMCGSNGTLLVGNAAGGFKSLSTVNDNQLFLSLCKFQEKIYLGSNLGLFVYDPNDHEKGIIKVVTGMTPELQDANIVDCAGDILWSIGPKDIARFDGTAWSRIHHPDNERIGE